MSTGGRGSKANPSIQITLDTYSHVAPGLQEAAAKRFYDIFVGEISKELTKKEH
jgi:hypothetical protein